MADPTFDLPLPEPAGVLDSRIFDLANSAKYLNTAGAPKPRYQVPTQPAPAAPQQGFLTDLGRGFARGAMVSLPEMTGQALQAFGADETGKAIADAAKARGQQPEYQVNPGGWGEAAASTVPALAAAGAFLIPGVGEVAGPALTAGLFGGSQYTSTRERGGSVGQALATGAVQGVGQAALSVVGGRVLQGAANVLKAPTAQGVLDNFANPSLWGRTLANTAKAAAIQVPTQAVASGAVAGIESDLPDTPSAWDAAKHSIAPTLMMTALMAPFAAVGTKISNKMREAVGEATANPIDASIPVSDPRYVQADKDRRASAKMIYNQMRAVDPTAAAAWYREAQLAIVANKPVAMDAAFKFMPLEEPTALPPAADEQKLLSERRSLPEDFPHQGLLNEDQRNAITEAVQRNNKLWAERDAYEKDQAEQRAAYASRLTPEEQASYERVVSGEPREKKDVITDAEVQARLQAHGEYVDKIERAKGNTADEAAAKAERDHAFEQIDAAAQARKQQDLALLRNDSQLPKAEYDAAVAERSGDVVFSQMRDAWERATTKAPDWEISGKGEAIWQATKQDRMQWLQGALGTKTPKLLNSLVDMGPAQLADSLKIQWEAKGGEGATAAYVPRLEALYRGLTGKDIRGESNENTNTETTPAANAANARSQVAGVSAEVPEAVRNAQTQVGEQNVNAIALQASGESRPAIQEARPEDGVRTGEVASVPEKGNAQGEGQSQAVPAEDVGTVTPKKVTAYAEAVNDRREAKTALDANRAEFDTLMRERSQVLAASKGKPTPEQAAELRRIESEAGVLAHAHEGLLQDHSDAVGAVEKLIGGGEPSAQVGYFSRITQPLDAKIGIGDGDNFAQLRAYLEAKVYTKTATPDQIETFGSLRGFKPVAGSINAAKAALDALSKPQREQYEYYVERYAGALKIAARMMKFARESEQRIADSMMEERMTEADFNARLDTIDTNLERGLITQSAADRAYVDAMNDLERRRQEGDTMGRGIAGFNDARLLQAVGKIINITDVLAHIGKVHSDVLTRTLATLYAKANPTALVRAPDNPDFNGGRYDPHTNTIELGRGGINTLTVMHETAHALTHAAIDNALRNEHRDQTKLHPADRAEIAALQTVRKTMDAFFNKADIRNPAHVLALQSEHEFIAEGLNNPTIREALGGRSSTWTRFVNALREMVGLEAKHQTQFEQLLDASQVLFGAPNRALGEVFSRGIAERNPGGPDAAVAGTNRFMESLDSVSAGLSGKFKRFAVDRLAGNQEVHAWLTLTDLERRADWLRSEIGTKYPSVAPTVNKLYDAITGFRDVANNRKIDSSHLLNGPFEAQALALRQHAMLKASPTGMELMNQIAHDARAIGIHPKYRTLAEAQQANPEITPEQFGHSVAVKARADYAKLVQISKAMEGRGETDTPLKVYEDGLQHNERVLARNFAQMLRGEVQDMQLPEAAGLDFVAHLRNADRSPISVNDQIRRLDRAIRETQSAVSRAAGTKQEPAAVAMKESVDGMIEEYDRQRKVPYYHLGREGDHFITFEVKGDKAEWDRVGAVVGGELKRDWRDVLPNGNRKVYMKFDGQYAHNDAVARIDTLAKAGIIDKYARGAVIDYTRASGGASPAFLRSMRNRIDGMDSALGWSESVKEQAKQALNDLYLSQLPESSPLKSAMLADNTVGASRDTTNMFVKRMEMGNRALVNARSALGFAGVTGRLQDAVRDLNGAPESGTEINALRNQMGVYVKELQARQADMQTPLDTNRGVAAARALTAQWRLGMAPMYVAMVAYQPYQITFPTLGAKYGYGSATMAMGRNTARAWGILNAAIKNGWMANEGDSTFNRLAKTSDIMVDASLLKNKDGTQVLDARQLDLLDHLQQTQAINFGLTHQVYKMDPADTSVLARVSRVTQLVPHYIEMANRILTALATHELAYAKGSTGVTETSKLNDIHEYAKREAMRTLRETEGDHSQLNVARRLGQRGVLKQATPLVVGFSQYNIQMTELLARTVYRTFAKDASTAEKKEMLKMLGGIAVTTTAVAGTLGLPFVGAAVGIYNMVAQALQEEGDTPPDVEKSYRDFMRGMLGNDKLEEVVSRGIPRVLGPGGQGIDMSTRSGYQELLPFTSILESRAKLKDRIKDNALDFMGPAVGVLSGIATGVNAMNEGDYVKAINDGLPAVLRNAAKAYRLSKYGYETSGGNNQIPLSVSNWDVMMQSVGALSSQKAEQTEKQFDQTVNQRVLQARHQVIMNEILRSADHGDYRALQQAMMRSVQFAMQQPQFRNFDVGQALSQRAQERAIGALPNMHGVMVTKGQLPYYQRFSGGMPEPR